MPFRQAIRNITTFTILVSGLGWLGPVLGGDPTAPGLGFLVWAIAPVVSALVVKFLLRDEVSLGFRSAFKGNGLCAGEPPLPRCLLNRLGQGSLWVFSPARMATWRAPEKT